MQARKLSLGSIRRWTLFAAALAILASCTSPIPDNFHLKSANERKATPDFSLKDATGATVKLSDYRGKVVLLNFWATWCGPCKIEIPWFMDFQKTYKDRDFAVVGVSLDEDGWDAVKPYVEQKKMNYRVVLGNDQISELFGNIESLPTTIVIDRQGRIASMHIGLVSKNTYQQEIEQLLEAPRNAPKPVLCALLAASSLGFIQINAVAQTSVLLVPKPEPVAAKAGTTVEVKLPLQLREGYHVNSNLPPDPYLIPLRLTWDSGPIAVTEVVYPQPSMHKVEFFAGLLPVFSGRFELLTRFKIPASLPPGLVNVPGKLRYQACNDRMCLPPKTIDLTLSVSVSR